MVYILCPGRCVAGDLAILASSLKRRLAFALGLVMRSMTVTAAHFTPTTSAHHTSSPMLNGIFY